MKNKRKVIKMKIEEIRENAIYYFSYFLLNELYAMKVKVLKVKDDKVLIEIEEVTYDSQEDKIKISKEKKKLKIKSFLKMLNKYPLVTLSENLLEHLEVHKDLLTKKIENLQKTKRDVEKLIEKIKKFNLQVMENETDFYMQR